MTTKSWKTTLKSCSEFLKSTFFPYCPDCPNGPNRRNNVSKCGALLTNCIWNWELLCNADFYSTKLNMATFISRNIARIPNMNILHNLAYAISAWVLDRNLISLVMGKVTTLTMYWFQSCQIGLTYFRFISWRHNLINIHVVRFDLISILDDLFS